MLKKFGDATKRVTPILGLMKDDTQKMYQAMQGGNTSQLANIIERLGLLTSRLYTEYLSCSNAFRENPDLMAEALKTLTASQQANIEAQSYLSSQKKGYGSLENGEEGEEASFFALAERRLTLVTGVIVPALLFFFSRELSPFKSNVVKGSAVLVALISLRSYYAQTR